MVTRLNLNEVRAGRAPSRPGTYVLLLQCRSGGAVAVGGLGRLRLRRGHYLYVGSAFGPGGLAARLRHHTHVTDRPHWHVDYLRARCVLTSVWFSASPRRLEHTWARTIGRLPGVEAPFPGFGTSDCECPTHLFWFQTVPACPFPDAGPLP
jgi:Uri superfamily endonuclease